MSEHSINDRIDMLIKSLGISQRKFAISLNVSPGRITNMIKNRNDPNFQFISKLISVYRNVNANWLLIGEGEMFLPTIQPNEVNEERGEYKTKVDERLDWIENFLGKKHDDYKPFK